ncbi:acyl-CoA thioesterase-2 [Alteromonadaceae bacterium Bs31]|nr:acyl-CoA thioesterase-2 [Alteromonadaceae bacterium Bs31]
MSSELQEIFDLEQLDLNLFRNRHHRENFKGTLFGGQVLSQALFACYKTLDQQRGPALPHSLHAYFLRAGKSDSPVIYDVEKVREGKSIVNRRVVARQYGRPIFNMSVSFHYPEEGFHHQTPFPANTPMPEELIEAGVPMYHGKHVPVPERGVTADNPFDMLPIQQGQFDSSKSLPAEAQFWIRTANTLSDEKIEHYCTLAFASDLGLLATALLPHGVSIFSSDIVAASVDHAMWFHSSEFRADEWLLCHCISPWAGSARGFTHASVFTKSGKLILSSAQEGLIRPATK